MNLSSDTKLAILGIISAFTLVSSFAMGFMAEESVVEFNPDELAKNLRCSIEEAIGNGLISDGQAGRFIRFYEDGLGGYTYLEESTVSESS